MDDIRKTVKKIVSEEIMTTYKEGLKMKADIYRLSEKLYRTNIKLWKEVQTDGKIPLSEKTIRNILITIENFDSGRKEYKTTID
ncbi:hypothetical protein ACOQFO_03200 [Ureibacillus sp. MALMAid1270]|uniref:hypothetical protein n=1 Tax=Ureibacillus sp. MALMAid1270 TaxID=3411629 RepID=UPI003BA4E316